ncbi:23168_t:CDS:10 [Rhizophagus irregularis]|nr:23168_t:CDS:10 [Rhizophagus irregularis]
MYRSYTIRYICGTEAYWKNVCKTYDWLKSLCQSSNKIATHKVFKGSKGRNGICKRFEKRKSKDRNLHPIPLLANGPDTGRSRLLQELPTLLREQAKNYTTDNELLKMINNQMYAINVTFGNDTPASDKDVCVKYRLGKLYPFEEFRTAITPVIADAVLNIPVEENKTDGGLSYVDLSSKGILNLESAHNNDLFYVRMPYLWLWILISYNESFEFWEVMIDQKSHVLWQDSEDFNMRFWLYAFDFFQYWIKYNVNYKFVLPDADSIKYHELEYQYPYTVQQEHLSLGTVYKNCPNAPWDVFFFLENCLFAIRVKAKQPQVLNKSMINGDGSMTEDALNNLQENCLVVHRANFKDFYGYIFSSRAEFSAANDKLDVNTAEDYELRTIKGIGNETAREIISKRPYVDEEDLYISAQVSNDYSQEQFSSYIDVLIGFMVPFVIFILADYEYDDDGSKTLTYVASTEENKKFNLFEPLKEKVERIIHLENKTHEIKFITLEEKFKKLEELFEQNVPFHQTYSSIVLIKPSKSTSEIAMKM